MHFIATASLLLLPLLTSAAPASSCPAPKPKAAAYFLDNNPDGANIVAVTIDGDDGLVSNPVKTSTGGRGLFALTASKTGGAPAAGPGDTLFSADSVVVSGSLLFTVNAGSNTVSAFTIPSDDPTHPELICSPVDTKGQFPMSVAYSPKWKTACVLNGGAVAGVSCFSVSTSRGLTPLGGLRPIAVNQTTPPVGPPGTASDIMFNPSQTALIVIAKSDGTQPGYTYAYPISHDGSIATEPILSRPSGLALEFSINFLGEDSRAVITDPSFGAAIVDVSHDFKFSVEHRVPIAGEGAICWAAYVPKYHTIFILDGGNTNITLMDSRSGKLTGAFMNAPETAVNLDGQTYEDRVYVLNAGGYITVLDTVPLGYGGMPSQVQHFDLKSVGTGQSFQGMAIYPSS